MAYAFSDIYTRVLDRAGINSSDSTRLAQVKRAINDAYKKWAAAKQWDDLTAVGVINVKDEYTAGTVAVTNGSTTVTGTSTVWTSAHLNRILKVSGYEETYKATTIGSNTVITLDQSYNGTTGATKGYTLYQPIYSLASTFDEFINPHHAFWPYYPVPVSIEDIRRLYNQYPTTTGKARYYTLIDPDSSNNRQVMIWPIPDADYNLKYDYKRTITELSADADVPLISDSWREAILVEGGLAIIYEVLGDTRADTQSTRFSKALLSMMARQKSTDRHSRVEVQDTYRALKYPSNTYLDNSWFTRRRINVP